TRSAALPGEPTPQRLNELVRSAGLDAGVVRLARRLLHSIRDQNSSAPIADMARVPAPERPIVLHAAFRNWLRGESAADLLDMASYGIRVRYAAAHPGFRPAALAAEVASARRFVAYVLRQAPTGSWYSLDDFIALIWQARPGLLRGNQQSWATPAWWLESTDD